MIQFYSLMWILAGFGAFLGFLRGWNREVIATAGILLATFGLFQFDALIRGTILLTIGLSRDQSFAIQLLIFFAVVYIAYQNRTFLPDKPRDMSIQTGILGGVIGAINGYLIGGALWYFVDINEYPFYPLIVAPSPGSPSANSVGSIPLVLLSGGATGSGDFLIVGVFVLFLLVLFVL